MRDRIVERAVDLANLGPRLLVVQIEVMGSDKATAFRLASIP